MFKFPKTNIYEVIQPFFYIIKFVSYACFSIKGNLTDGIIYTSIFDLCTYIFFLCFNVGVLYMSFVSENHISESKILEFGSKCVLWVSMTIAIVAETLIFVFRHRAWKILKCCYNFDNQIAYFGHEFNHQMHFVGFSIYTSASLFLMHICILVTMSQSQFVWMNFLFCYISNANYIIVMNIFVMFISAIKIRFAAMNKCFEETFLSSPKSTIKTVQPKDTTDYVSRFGGLYTKLNDAVDLLNFCCSFQLMLCFGLFFVYSIFTVFAGYRIILNYDEKTFNIALSSFFWNLLYFKYVFTIIAVSSSITTEGKNTTTLIHKAINKLNNGDLVERLFWFSQQVGQRIPVINCGLFPFDWTLFYSITAASTTYLVILIQFESSMA